VLAQKLAQLPLTQANARAFARFMLAGAMDVEVDGQGRVVIPEYLRTYATLQKQVVVAGLYNRVEIWDEQAWMAYTAHINKESGSIAEQLLNLGV
jgi:MraZ protein